MGFRPVPGTLNVVLDQPFSRGPETQYIPATQLRADWESATGQAGYWLTPMIAGGRHEAVAVQADEPHYPAEQLEIVCGVRLRDALGLSDGDAMELLVVPRPAEGQRWIAGAVIHDGSGRIFMQRRSEERDLFPGAWDIVGGHLEPGEGILDALRREVNEETGWTFRRVLDDAWGHDVLRRGWGRTPRGRLPGRGGRQSHRAPHRGAAAPGSPLGGPRGSAGAARRRASERRPPAPGPRSARSMRWGEA